MAQREETDAERKIRLRRAEMEADLENVRALVGDLGGLLDLLNSRTL